MKAVCVKGCGLLSLCVSAWYRFGSYEISSYLNLEEVEMKMLPRQELLRHDASSHIAAGYTHVPILLRSAVEQYKQELEEEANRRRLMYMIAQLPARQRTAIFTFATVLFLGSLVTMNLAANPVDLADTCILTGSLIVMLLALFLCMLCMPAGTEQRDKWHKCPISADGSYVDDNRREQKVPDFVLARMNKISSILPHAEFHAYVFGRDPFASFQIPGRDAPEDYFAAWEDGEEIPFPTMN